MDAYANSAAEMSADTAAKARYLGRPMSSFRERDMTLNCARPSVLLVARSGNTQELAAAWSGNAHVPAALSIRTPHRVLSAFSDSAAGDDSLGSASGASPPAGKSVAEVYSVPLADGSGDGCDMGATGQSTGRVQWKANKDVREYAPTPRSPISPPNWKALAARGPTPAARPRQGAAAFPPALSPASSSDAGISRHVSNASLRAGTSAEHMGGADASAEDEDMDGGVSRRMSNLNTRSGTFAELVGASVEAAAAHSEHEDGGVSRCRSNMSKRAGTFHELKGGSGGAAGSSNPLSSHQIALEDSDMDFGGISRHVSSAHYGAGTFDTLYDASMPQAALITLDAAPPASVHLGSGGSTADDVAITTQDLLDPMPSRRAGNMHNRVGTFEEVLESGVFLNGAPADTMPPPPRIETFTSGHLLDIDPEDPSPMANVSRCASNMYARAGRFSELVPGSPASSASEITGHAGNLAELRRADTDVPSDDDAGELSGAISRRATNMGNAAGHFDALVDDDGDTLSEEQFSDTEGDMLVDRVGSLENGSEPSRGCAVSFAGMVSDADVLRAAGNGTPESARAVAAHERYGAFDSLSLEPLALAMAPERSADARGAASVRNIMGASAQAEAPGMRDSWQTVAGGLVSDTVMSEDEGGVENPFDSGARPLVQEASGTSIYTRSSMPADTHSMSQSKWSSLHLNDAPSATASLANAGSFVLPPPSAASLRPIATPRGRLRQVTEYATISFSGAPSRVTSSTNTDLGNAVAAASGGAAGGLASQLSVQTPRQRFGVFKDAQAAAAQAYAPGSAPSMAASLAATASFTSDSGIPSHLSVRTPRRGYGLVHGGADAGAMALPPPVRGHKGPTMGLTSEPVVTTQEWLTKVMSMNPQEQAAPQPSAMSMLSAKEWAAGVGAGGGVAGNTVSNKNARFIPEDSLAGTTLFGAFRPEGSGLGV